MLKSGARSAGIRGGGAEGEVKRVGAEAHPIILFITQFAFGKNILDTFCTVTILLNLIAHFARGLRPTFAR